MSIGIGKWHKAGSSMQSKHLKSKSIEQITIKICPYPGVLPGYAIQEGI